MNLITNFFMCLTLMGQNTQVDKLIKDLDNARDWKTRETLCRAIYQYDLSALKTLNAYAANHPNPEVSLRCRKIVEKIWESLWANNIGEYPWLAHKTDSGSTYIFRVYDDEFHFLEKAKKLTNYDDAVYWETQFQRPTTHIYNQLFRDATKLYIADMIYCGFGRKDIIKYLNWLAGEEAAYKQQRPEYWDGQNCKN